MKIIKWLTNKTYRRHRWARKHLTLTRIMRQAGINYREFWEREKESKLLSE